MDNTPIFMVIWGCFVLKKIVSLMIAICLLSGQCFAVTSLQDEDIQISSPSAVLMEASTGSVIYEKDAHSRRSPASVTKVMTMLLVMEAIEAGDLSYDTRITASAHAANMGGSQIWLEEGESMSVDEMLKCVAVVSANDCAVALAEHIAGTEEAFVKRMNERAAELSMENTHFTNCTGLFESDEHYTSAYDIALMSRELLKHRDICRYTTIWMDEVRDGRFGLSNTNKLVRYYEGTTGLKTGFTSNAMYCLSASAEKDGVEYIAVIMHGLSSAERFDDAKTLLNYAFANYKLLRLRPDEALAPVRVSMGEADAVSLDYDGNEYLLLEKTSAKEPEFSFEMAEEVKAPVRAGQQLGVMTVQSEGTVLAKIPLCAHNDVEKLGFAEIYGRFLHTFFGG